MIAKLPTLVQLLLLQLFAVLLAVKAHNCPAYPITCVNQSQIASCGHPDWVTENCDASSTCMTMSPNMVHCMKMAGNEMNSTSEASGTTSTTSDSSPAPGSSAASASVDSASNSASNSSTKSSDAYNFRTGGGKLVCIVAAFICIAIAGL
ncbi:hypothetical protein AX774_g4863 [Zancudomyces culisetae]|uniref:Extracellular membrane protein CFEM domain-containing protein n=1 Tax=Zancudomyces culisetae TaxID=1213189 RepID=A0A1R1PL26_ZANCU|nr:hypothetical protein AX774_g4863 [Zancudomyces culisetae]|eukprot:OMH81678.1 hypothetical protein AX774_g4863 [Zancudomyces culisetae]